MSQSRHRHAPDALGRASRKKVVIVALGSAVVIIAGAIALTLGFGTSAKHAAAAQPSASVAATASPGGSHSQPHLRTAGGTHHRSDLPAPPKVRVIDTYRGVGSGKTGGFTVLGTGDWVLKWSYRCPASSTPGSFVVSEDGGFDEDGVNVDEHGSARHGQTRVFGDVGQHYLSVRSTCSWKVEVTGRW
jgi:hypothetical protein